MRIPVLECHEFALLFPPADREDRQRLKDDIRKHGIKVPIVLFEGKILDGRSRYEIARELGLMPPTTEFRGTTEEALALAASYNLYRRHLNQSQKAVVAAKLAVKLRRKDNTPPAEAREIAARMTGASVSTTERAERILEQRPKVAQQILNGKKTVGEVVGRSATRCPPESKLIPELRCRLWAPGFLPLLEVLDTATQYAFLSRLNEGKMPQQALAEVTVTAQVQPPERPTRCPRCGHEW